MRLRFFLDAGSGVCLWAWDAPAKQRFGYAVELDDVPLPRDLVADLMLYLITLAKCFRERVMIV